MVYAGEEAKYSIDDLRKALLHVDRPTKHDQGYAGGDAKQYFRMAYYLPLLHDARTSLACPTKPSIFFLRSQQPFACQRR